jgi:hypothetical protein
MNGLCPGCTGGIQNARSGQIALRRCGRAYANCFFCHLNVQGSAIGFRKDSNTSNVHFAERTNDTNRDFPPIRNQDLLKQIWNLAPNNVVPKQAGRLLILHRHEEETAGRHSRSGLNVAVWRKAL